MKLINADELDKVKFHPLPYTHITPSDADAESYKRGWNDAIDAIMSEAPTIEERKTGRWILTEDDDYEYCTCSECGYQNGENWMNGSDIPFCAMCGADMRGESNETD